jgi:hypothetical protein
MSNNYYKLNEIYDKNNNKLLYSAKENILDDNLEVKSRQSDKLINVREFESQNYSNNKKIFFEPKINKDSTKFQLQREENIREANYDLNNSNKINVRYQENNQMDTTYSNNNRMNTRQQENNKMNTTCQENNQMNTTYKENYQMNTNYKENNQTKPRQQENYYPVANTNNHIM